MSTIFRNEAPRPVDTKRTTTDNIARKDSAVYLSSGYLGPFELEATPISPKHDPRLPNQQADQEEKIASLTSTLDKITLQALKAKHEHDNLLAMVENWRDLIYSSHKVLRTVAKDARPPDVRNIHDPFFKSAPDVAPPYLSHTDYLRVLTAEDLDYITPYAKCLDANTNYTVASTNNPERKRCKVGRPRGKILRPGGGDDLYKRLCDFHKDEEGFEIQVNRGEDPMVCRPLNLIDEDPDE
jgi:hypothetical protein